MHITPDTRHMWWYTRQLVVVVGLMVVLSGNATKKGIFVNYTCYCKYFTIIEKKQPSSIHDFNGNPYTQEIHENKQVVISQAKPFTNYRVYLNVDILYVAKLLCDCAPAHRCKGGVLVDRHCLIDIVRCHC